MRDIDGAVESIEAHQVHGWARPHDLREPVIIDVLDGEVVLGSGPVDKHRADLGGSFGFSVVCVALEDLAVLTGRLRVIARRGVDVSLLAILSSARSRVAARFIAAIARDFNSNDIEHLIGAIVAANPQKSKTAASIPSPDYMELSKLLRLAGWPQAQQLSANELTQVAIRVGSICWDGSALVGNCGEIYLVGGGNQLLKQFIAPAEASSIEELAANWTARLLERMHRLRAFGTKFVQIIIPEKLSVYPECFPVYVPTPTPLLRALETKIKASELLNHTLLARQELQFALPAQRIFPKMDSHLTVHATYTVFAALLRIMGLESPFILDLSERVFLVGDLTQRFFDTPLYEEYAWPSAELAECFAESLELLTHEAPAEGHTGIKYVWRNTAAPFNLRVVAFANSFFERGGSARSLSWWCCRAFREFHFIWSPNLEMKYVVKTNPDWVICQTIERFLPNIPQDDYS